jgi:hypothetical protein
MPQEFVNPENVCLSLGYRAAPYTSTSLDVHRLMAFA